MAFYLAVVKIHKDGIPSKMTFAAQDATAAVREMCKLVNVSTSMEIHEYDILEIVNGGGNYRPVAAKIGLETYAYRASLKDNSKIETPKLDIPLDEEKSYSPYSVEKAI